MNIGKIKAIFDREFQYVSKVNPVLIGYLFIKEVGWNWWYTLAVPIFLIWVYIDLKYIMPQEQLINKHYSINGQPIFSKEYALITVNEIIEQWEYIDTYLADGRGELNPNLKYWYEVKKYIKAF